MSIRYPSGNVKQTYEYTSLEFSKCTQNKGIIQSFSKKGCPYDNACIESFHAVLKKEEVYRVKYRL